MERQDVPILSMVESSMNRRHFLKATTFGVSSIAIGSALGIALPETVFANDSGPIRPNDTVAFYRLFKGATGDHFYTANKDEADNAVKNYGYTYEGIACYVYSYGHDDTTALYRLYRPSTQHHFYTTDAAEAQYAIQHYGYNSEGTACYVYATKGEQAPDDSVKLYRLYKSGNDDHFYTTNKDEADNAIHHYGYHSEGTACYVYAPNSRPYRTDKARFYRLYRPSTQHHFYTTSKSEADNAVKKYGYKREGVAGYVYSSDESNINDTTALYRLYKPGNDDHFYTTNKAEADYAVQNYGYNLEGVACYVYGTNDHPYGTTPLYRLYKPGTGDHFYTANKGEADYAIQHFGYNSEGVACYLYPAS